MDPAYHIPLKPAQLRMIGEICAIQGQIEWTMQSTVMKLLRIEEGTALAIMGSASLATNADIWIRVIREKLKHKAAQAHAEAAFTEMAAITRGRNDFVHAVYGFGWGLDEPRYFLSQSDASRAFKRVAIRTRGRKIVPLDYLPDIRSRVAEASVRIAYVNWIAVKGPKPIPYLDRLAPLPLPPKPKREKTQRAKAPRPQPQS